ncbi:MULTISPECIES: LysE family translocator [unclassified Crossiella]|uniref:LysE family translocator n=1 Tax=unclassified Crossiella TaxID=2620835 RepID=UPI001FFE52D4|nr:MULTISPECIES: LysE family translocator [unclassified Crossiella]MCK2243189.1 LysE family translocator [Crossiella sp. S99.2]MCK2254342.1 LysE family translocator [Crossiella sp. S99.1]
MSGELLLAYCLAAVVLVVTPGLDTMLILRSVVLGGRRTGLATGLGITLGCLVWGAASIAGITALLRASEFGYNALRLAGAVYLVWLGGSALWRSWRDRGKPTQVDDQPELPALGGWRALRSGLLTNLLNPKVGVFYLSLLPQFLPAAGPTTGWAALLVLIHVGLGFLWQFVLVGLAGSARRWLSRRRVRTWLDRLTATILLGLGLRLALQGP